MELGLELALVRWETVGKEWREVGGLPPDLSAFLCGWFAHSLYDRRPDPERKLDSWRAGWFQAETMRSIDKGRPVTPGAERAAANPGSGEVVDPPRTPTSGSLARSR